MIFLKSKLSNRLFWCFFALYPIWKHTLLGAINLRHNSDLRCLFNSCPWYLIACHYWSKVPFQGISWLLNQDPPTFPNSFPDILGFNRYFCVPRLLIVLKQHTLKPLILSPLYAVWRLLLVASLGRPIQQS